MLGNAFNSPDGPGISIVQSSSEVKLNWTTESQTGSIASGLYWFALVHFLEKQLI
jgi:hypothetical protein